jgi:hypothetical protein
MNDRAPVDFVFKNSSAPLPNLKKIMYKNIKIASSSHSGFTWVGVDPRSRKGVVHAILRH